VKLYDYFRSSAAYRVRIALNLKRLQAERAFIHLRRNVQREAEYLAVNPQGLVPTLVADDGSVLTQSLAIIEYLDETHPTPPLLPVAPAARARVRSIALDIACDIHPIDNLRVLRYLLHTVGTTEAHKDAWYNYWIDVGLEALETRLARDAATGRFCHGDTPTLADICLVPQLANARRVELDLAPYPTLTRIETACLALPAFADAQPDRQPDAEA
jgi:maleylacetoacetate isomerase